MVPSSSISDEIAPSGWLNLDRVPLDRMGGTLAEIRLRMAQ
jgi:hypothetical protein